MLKRRDSPYGVGRKRGDWWKWKIEPHTMDAVLIYAQPGSGKRASLLTDYTFGVWHNGELVPIAKAYSGLSNDEIAELDRWIRITRASASARSATSSRSRSSSSASRRLAASSRHKSGIAVRFPRMLRWRKDKKPADADTLETVREAARAVTAPGCWLRSSAASADGLQVRVERAHGGRDRVRRSDEELLGHRFGIIGCLVVLGFVFDAKVNERNARLVKGIVVRVPRPVVFALDVRRVVPRAAAPPAPGRRP